MSVITYGTLFSGIEAPSVAWGPLGWKPLFPMNGTVWLIRKFGLLALLTATFAALVCGMTVDRPAPQKRQKQFTHGAVYSWIWPALMEVALRQSEHQREANPVDRFLTLLRSAISAGHAHLATRDGGMPDNPGAWGWRTRRTRDHRRTERLPQGARVGWLDSQDLFLDIDSAYRAAQTMAADGDGIAVGVHTLVKRLNEAGWLKSVDERRGKLKIRRVIDGRRLKVLHLPADVLERAVLEKTSPIGPSTGAKNDLPGSREMGGFGLVNWVP